MDGPAVWRRFRPFIDRIPNRVGSHTFGLNEVVDMAAGDLAYASAVEVSGFGGLPDDLQGRDKPLTKTLEGGRFAVFAVPLSGRDIGAGFRRANGFVYGAWEEENRSRLRARYDFECYGERFSPETLAGRASIRAPARSCELPPLSETGVSGPADWSGNRSPPCRWRNRVPAFQPFEGLYIAFEVANFARAIPARSRRLRPLQSRDFPLPPMYLAPDVLAREKDIVADRRAVVENDLQVGMRKPR